MASAGKAYSSGRKCLSMKREKERRARRHCQRYLRASKLPLSYSFPLYPHHLRLPLPTHCKSFPDRVPRDVSKLPNCSIELKTY